MILFNLTIRFSLLRLICLLALVSIVDVITQWKENNIYGPQDYYPVVLAPVIFSHHFLSAFGPRLSLPRFLDLSLLIAEICGTAYSLRFKHPHRWSPQIFIFSLTTWCMLLLFLAGLGLLRGLETYQARGNLFKPFNINQTKDAKKLEDNSVLYVLTGRKIWMPQIGGEPKWLITSRGMLAILFVLGTSVFALFSIILDPIHETALAPLKDVRTQNIPMDFKITLPAVWNVIVTRLVYLKDFDLVDDFPTAIEVIPLWGVNSSDSSAESSSDLPPCVHVPDFDTSLEFDYLDSMYLLVTVFHCPTRVPIPEVNMNNVYPLPYQNSQPDLLVVVNFTMLNISFDSWTDTARNSVQVMVALTNHTTNALEKTEPATLIPGVNVVGFLNMVIRRQFVRPVWSAFGLFDSMDSYLVSEMTQILPDPRAQSLPFIPHSPEISTIRLVNQATYDWADWNIRQEYREKSVLSGLASVGGLWTSIGGFFLIIFGAPALRILFGIKPLSTFGLVHKFEKEKEIRERFRAQENYPKLEHDLGSDHKGVLYLICDQLLDLDLLRPNEVMPTKTEDTSSA